jgi:steroid delta-isomerase-like uncharacterized protein
VSRATSQAGLSRATKALVARWHHEVWNERRDATIDEMMHPECIVELEGSGGPLTRDRFKEYRYAFLNAVPDLTIEVSSIMADGERAASSWCVRGRHLGPGLGIPPSGRPVQFTGMSHFEFRDGLFVRGFDRWNRGELIASLMQVRIEELIATRRLTAREAQVALMMAERLTSVEIALELGIATATARRHCERVLRKLGITSRFDVADAIGKPSPAALKKHGHDVEPRARQL